MKQNEVRGVAISYKPVTPTQHLGKVAEELGEVLHAIGKTLRFGFASRNPETLGEGCCAKCGQQSDSPVHSEEAAKAFKAYGAKECKFEDMRETNAAWIRRELNDAEEAVDKLRQLLRNYTPEILDGADHVGASALMFASTDAGQKLQEKFEDEEEDDDSDDDDEDEDGDDEGSEDSD